MWFLGMLLCLPHKFFVPFGIAYWWHAHLLLLHHLTQLFAKVSLASQMPGTSILHFLRIYMAKWMLSYHESQSLNSCRCVNSSCLALYMFIYSLNSLHAEKTSWPARTSNIWDSTFFFWLSGIAKINVSVYSSRRQDPLRQTTWSCCSHLRSVCGLYVLACRIPTYLILDPLHLKVDRTILHVCLVSAVNNYHMQ